MKNELAWKRKWDSFQAGVHTRKAECRLTFEQYMKLAEQAGITDPACIGRKDLYSFQLGRYGDVGPYEIGNCRFITMRQNLLERSTEQIAIKSKNRNKFNCEGRLNQSKKISKKFLVISPSGERFEGTNLKEFCIQHGLNQGRMSRVCSGKETLHKGWSGKYLEEKNEKPL